MRALLASLLLVAAASPIAAELPPPQPVRIVVDVDATGHVTRAELADKLPEAAAARIVERVSAFEFEPASRDGKPASCRTTLWLQFAFEALDDDRVAIRISDAYTGAGYVGKQVNPTYPTEAVRKRLNGEVSLRLDYDAAGRVTTVAILSWSGHKSFGAAAAAAVRQWHMLPEQVDGEPVPGSAILPVSFRVTDGRMPKASGGEQPLDASDGPPRQLVADSAVTLRTQVAGSLL